MNVEIAAFCEYACLRQGQLSLLNTIANWAAKEFPTCVPGTLITQLRLLDDDNGDHLLQWRLCDEDGGELWEGPRNVASIKVEKKTSAWADFVTLAIVLFPGQYEFRLEYDGKIVATLPLGVTEFVVPVQK